jgi:ATP-dependent helicase HrpB
MALERLPIEEVLPELVRQLSSAGAVVLKAEPGAGKTTRVPPAVLDAGLADLSNKRPGQIIVLQPRRVAARAAAARISDERGTELGAEIGYQVRHESRVSKQTRIVVCTEGIFLRRLQDDPLLENTAVVVFDEFHERSLDSDVALALTRLVREQVRPDLRIVVMSATLDAAPVSAYLGGCPSIECPGRTFPIELEYLQFPSNLPVDRLAADGIKQMVPRTSGHLLVFLPGVGEIRQTGANIETFAQEHDLAITPLYGEMPLDEQQLVLRPSKKRKLILCTNIAETSLTVDGVTAVVDTGLARINRFDPQFGLNRLELSRISRASATQRAGRAGRTGPGKALRLWTEREQLSLAEFELPEIARVDLSESVLRIIDWGERDLYAFPWYEPPPRTSIEQALSLLDRLDAISDGSITELGRQMVGLPLQPRLARLLLEGVRLGSPDRAALCAALLSERSPFRRTQPRDADERRGGASGRPWEQVSMHQSDSDVLDRIAALEAFADKSAPPALTGVELSPGAAKFVLRASDQLRRLVSDYGIGGRRAAPADGTGGLQPASATDDAILRALAIAFPDRICKRRQPRDKRAVMVGGRGVKLADDSALWDDTELFVAVESVDLDKTDLLVRQASRVERDWLPESHITTSIDVSFDTTRQKVVAMKRTRFCDLILEESIAAIPPDIDPGAVLAEAVAANLDINALVDDDARNYLARIECLRAALPELQLPDFGDNPWLQLLPVWCCGVSSVAELKSNSLVHAIQSRLTHQQTSAIDQEAPERLPLPGGRSVKLQYEAGKPPVLAARIQELFGMAETPRIARGRLPVLVHLLAPNYRVQQITPDLASFWKNTYADVKKELKGRYPKHKWPDDPFKIPTDSKS